jgi:lipoprotein-releasing system permease protein
MMVTNGSRTATGVLLKGVDPVAMPKVLDLPKHIVKGSLDSLRRPGAKPPERGSDPFASTSKESTETKPLDRDGGGAKTLLQIMQEEVDAEMRAADAGAKGAAPVDAGAGTPDQPAPPGGRGPAAAGSGGREIVGDVTPDGGYKSVLPDEDVLPDVIDPDPCKSPEQVAKMPGIVVGRTLAQQLDVDLGDCIQVTSPQIGISFGSSARPPIAKQFRVIAIFEAGFDQYDSKLVYTDLYEAQAFYEYGDSVTGIEMRIDDIDRADQVAKDIAKKLDNGIYNTMTWHQLNRGLFTALLIQQIGMSAVLGLIILVAACTVIATIIMVVLEKKKEIALLKALGARDDAVLRIFLYQGGIIGLSGTALGILLGWLCCRFLLYYGFPLDPKVYFISRLPVSMHPVEFIVPAVVAIVICLLATILPAVYAARLRPADGLRAE